MNSKRKSHAPVVRRVRGRKLNVALVIKKARRSELMTEGMLLPFTLHKVKGQVFEDGYAAIRTE